MKGGKEDDEGPLYLCSRRFSVCPRLHDSAGAVPCRDAWAANGAAGAAWRDNGVAVSGVLAANTVPAGICIGVAAYGASFCLIVPLHTLIKKWHRCLERQNINGAALRVVACFCAKSIADRIVKYRGVAANSVSRR